MSHYEKNVNGSIELVVDSALTALDARVGVTEQHLRQVIGLNSDSPAEDAYIGHIEAINRMWKVAVDAAFWVGYKLGQEERFVS